MAEIDSPDDPGERLVICKNPLLEQERARKRGELLAATEKELIRIQARVQRANKKLHGAAAIGQAVGAALGRRKMAKHFQISISDDAFSFARNDAAIAAEAALDGIYVVRTNLPAAQSDAAATVRVYKSLSGVEHAFRWECPKTGGITPPLPVVGLGWRPAQTAGRAPNRARRCRPHSEPGAEDRRLFATIASAAICSFVD
jgi:hypothetical protein